MTPKELLYLLVGIALAALINIAISLYEIAKALKVLAGLK